MRIIVTCEACGRSFRVDSQFAGRMGKCPQCKAVVEVPLILQAAEPDEEPLVLELAEDEAPLLLKLADEPDASPRPQATPKPQRSTSGDENKAVPIVAKKVPAGKAPETKKPAADKPTAASSSSASGIRPAPRPASEAKPAQPISPASQPKAAAPTPSKQPTPPTGKTAPTAPTPKPAATPQSQQPAAKTAARPTSVPDEARIKPKENPVAQPASATAKAADSAIKPAVQKPQTGDSAIKPADSATKPAEQKPAEQKPRSVETQSPRERVPLAIVVQPPGLEEVHEGDLVEIGPALGGPPDRPILLTPAAALAQPAPVVTVAQPVTAVAATAAGVVQPAPSSMARALPTPQAPVDRGELERRVLGGFSQKIAPVELPGSYHFGLLLTSAVMFVIPLLYLGLIGLVGWAMYWYVTVNAKTMAAAGKGSIIILSPLLLGVVLILFMIKPLFARSGERRGVRSIDRSTEPLLFAFVDRICEAIDGPRPSRIDIDCNVNASARFESFFSKSLVLTIGLPLAAGLNLRQLAGVLAHEFGHFTQETGMRATYLVRAVSYWLTRVVYERDAWDERLVRLSHAVDLRIGWIFYLVRILVWLSRRSLWVLMMLGHAVAGFMLRQMEMDADRHEARVAGSDVFESTTRRLAVLGVATQGAYADLGEFQKEGRLGDNLPLLIVSNVDQIPAEIRKKIDQSIEESETGWLDTHPADKERIASARREQAPGVFHVDLPVSSLFSDFAGLCRGVTYDFYREVFGPEFDAKQMHPTEKLLARQDRDREADKALGRYFQGQFGLSRPLRLPPTPPRAPDNVDQAIGWLRAAHAKFLELLPAYKQARDAFNKADERMMEAREAIEILRLGFSIAKDTYSVPMYSLGEAEIVRQQAAAQAAQLGPYLGPFEEVAAARLWTALGLAFVPEISQKIPNAPRLHQIIYQLLSVLQATQQNKDRFVELWGSRLLLQGLFSNWEQRQNDQGLINAILRQTPVVLQRIEELRICFATIPYPFDHAKGSICIGNYLLETLPPADQPGDVYEAAMETTNSFGSLHFRVAGRLAALAEEVEKILGMPPLPDPPEEKETPEG